MLRSYSSLFALPVLALAMTACSQSNDSAAGASAPAAGQGNAKVIRIATESSYKPFSYMDSQGNLMGFEIDLANAMCKEMKAECKITSEDWDGLIPGLNAQKFDAIMAGMSITPERSQAVLFSDPYFHSKLVLVGKKGVDTTIANIGGHSIATQQATVSAQYLEKNHPTAQIKTYDKQDNAYLDLTAGRAEFMLSDIVPISDWLKSDKGQGFEVKGAPIDINDAVAIALRKNDTALAGEFNKALQTLKANGEYDKIVLKYFDPSIVNAGAKTQSQTASAEMASSQPASAVASAAK
ncbi:MULTISPECIES: transporter substrate-binding domain-containing protein [unclassified Acinetobacter]|uniref:transporter substrate-binding domain-containing protein n=1 Tax=unclassified Acinetobacter TaxID=196816 RepID=UPI0035BADD00